MGGREGDRLSLRKPGGRTGKEGKQHENNFNAVWLARQGLETGKESGKRVLGDLEYSDPGGSCSQTQPAQQGAAGSKERPGQADDGGGGAQTRQR